MSRSYRVVALPGEGIGPEVVESALRVLQQLAMLHGFSVAIAPGLIGNPALEACGEYFPVETAQLCEGANGILLGAVSKGGLLELRKHFDFFINLRPVRPSPALWQQSPLKAEFLHKVDLLFVRELAGGIYFGASGRSRDNRGCYGFHTMQYHDHEIQRIARVALHHAQQRRCHLTVAHKENALPHLPWTALVQSVAAEFPDVTVEPMLVDNLAMQLIRQPQRFDVILAGNLFGDILSDLGGAIAGSIGLLGSASLNEQGFGLYEPVHGTAPDIAGQGIANPMGAIASVGLMLQQWGEAIAAAQLSVAQEALLAQGYRTADLTQQAYGSFVTTQEWTQLLISRLNA